MYECKVNRYECKMYLIPNVVINFSLLQVKQAFQVYVYASSSSACERDDWTLKPCVRLANLDQTLRHDLEWSDTYITLT